LPQVGEAVDHVPLVVGRQLVVGFEAGVDAHDGELDLGQLPEQY
jgi:hypothetical protein